MILWYYFVYCFPYVNYTYLPFDEHKIVKIFTYNFFYLIVTWPSYQMQSYH